MKTHYKHDDNFSGRIISRNGDFIRFRRLKTTFELLAKLSHNCKNVMKNFPKRITIYKKSGGDHLADIVLHV
ncbi:hypothetical protein ALC62_05693 [Cyphomyrmex costatus]|uniref:Uncharacterized protein n=1 Tax=Cyphomyrmex costatus TaxID=456900 RepID=A0A195CS96_9HYME|nr:hypothetical protein ALC62_05693 [Cyphomyrmex costatus]